MSTLLRKTHHTIKRKYVVLLKRKYVKGHKKICLQPFQRIRIFVPRNEYFTSSNLKDAEIGFLNSLKSFFDSK